MNDTLSSLFQKAQSSTIEVNGRTVHSILKINMMRNQQSFQLKRLSAKAAPEQGLRIKVDKGNVEVNGQLHPEVILWASTSPDVVIIKVHARPGAELKFWNVWKIDEIIQAWVGNAGIAVEEAERIVTLRCSDGSGEIDFSSLVIEIEEIAEG
ncbi:MAG: hypothetical protein ACOY82_18470 [Pseudomonadota bacterium]